MILLASSPPATESCLEARASLMSTRWEENSIMLSTISFTFWARKNMLIVRIKALQSSTSFLKPLSYFQVLNPKKKGRKKKYINSGTVSRPGLSKCPLLQINFHNDSFYLIFHTLSRWRFCPSKWNPSTLLWTSSGAGESFVQRSVALGHLHYSV